MANSCTTFTAAQRRVVEWLPPDGSWRTNPGLLDADLSTFSVGHRDVVDFEWGDFGPYGKCILRWRLSKDGIALVAKLREREVSR